MPFQENDISWAVLRRIVRDWRGAAAELEEVKPLMGGAINTTLCLRVRDGERAVLKITPHRVNRAYEEEAYQLNLLRSLGLPAPEVHVCKIGSLDDPHSYLLMQFMEGVNLAEARRACSAEQFDHLQMHLADLVISMHEHTGPHYQRVCDGQTQRDGVYGRWCEFFHAVFDPIYAQVAKHPALAPKTRKQLGKIHEKLERLLDHNDRPRLVHSDLWSTNLLARPDEHGRWWVTAVLDPNCKFAHAEAEIAYLELFNTVTPAFLRAYQQTHRLPPEYQRLRKLIYQLYPLMNHVRLFGNEYIKPLTALAERTAALV